MKSLQKDYKAAASPPSSRAKKPHGDATSPDKCGFTVKPDLSISTWNSAMEKLSLRTADNVVGKKLDSLYPFLQEEAGRVFLDGKTRRLKEFSNACFMGTDLNAEIRIIPVKTRSGKVKELEIELRNLSGTCPLVKKLSDSEKMVAIGKVASSLAHGIRNPLNAIKGAVVYLKEKYGHEPTLLEFSTIINDEIDRLDSFVSSFLSAAKGENSFVPVDVNDVLKSILSMIRPRAKTQNIEICCSRNILPSVSANPFQIEQALFNIINNAMEAMPEGGKINVKTSMQWEGDDDFAVIEIADTGRGIPEKELTRLGELSDDSERKDKGFGIFLSREIIKSHNGKLLWESVMERGTTFKIFLPVNNIG